MLVENALLVLALAADVVYPLLNWKLGLPEEFRWVSHAAILVLIVLGLLRALTLRQFPVLLLVLAGWLFFSAVQVLTNGQSISATAWGFYFWLRFPLIGLYAYTRPKSSFDALRYLVPVVLFLCGLNLVIQVIQFFTGESPGDNLAGFWGWHGTGRMASFICLALSLAFGRWIVKGASKGFWSMLGIGIGSSLLGDTKVFPAILVVMGIPAILFYASRRRKLLSGLALVGGLFSSVLAFDQLRNRLGRPAEPIIGNTTVRDLMIYLSFSQRFQGGVSYVGRLVQLEYIWRQIAQGPFTFLFGLGIGSLEQSQALGSSGLTLLTGALGVFGAVTLTALLGDFGIIGILALAWLLLAMVSRLFTTEVHHGFEEIRMGFVLFILTLPVWFFYLDIWTTPITMLVFWFGAGQLLQARKARASGRLVPVTVRSFAGPG